MGQGVIGIGESSEPHVGLGQGNITHQVPSIAEKGKTIFSRTGNIVHGIGAKLARSRGETSHGKIGNRFEGAAALYQRLRHRDGLRRRTATAVWILPNRIFEERDHFRDFLRGGGLVLSHGSCGVTSYPLRSWPFTGERQDCMPLLSPIGCDLLG